MSVRQALTLILQPLGLDFTFDGALVRVFRPEPEVRLFDINYIAASRAGGTTVGAATNVVPGAQVTSSTSIDSFDDLTQGIQSRVESAAQSKARDRSLTGVRITDVTRFMNALKRQGKVTTLADPQILSLKNEPAILRAISETTTLRKEQASDSVAHDDGLTLSVTPRIGADGIVMLSLNPSLSVSSGDDYVKAKGRLVREALTLARVAFLRLGTIARGDLAEQVRARLAALGA